MTAWRGAASGSERNKADKLSPTSVTNASEYTSRHETCCSVRETRRNAIIVGFVGCQHSDVGLGAISTLMEAVED
ncbi:hypothetical protein IE4771_PB00237 (plasmid) [Rhizobium etli bv. mimosae str. IE4771]|uniref:Uncharacterized protein n=1 Tax=Rhizobium etli bv. mimosae str. IE4771 TaxID=1432050 RepID=A0A060I7X0_RHIET|nr:hypothetical protein IE4771_PB00237 [Rhizobium sp. IE4771]